MLTRCSSLVTLTRAEYETLLDRIEEAEDNAFLDRVEMRETTIGFAEARADYLPIEAVKALSAGEHPIRVWRQHRGLTRQALAANAGVAPSYQTEIETGRKPGSFVALARLAAALRMSLDDDLAPWLNPAE